LRVCVAAAVRLVGFDRRAVDLRFAKVRR
jgi:hypothetical protein